MAKKIRVGFIAAGGISHGHFIRLHETKKAQVVALNDPSDKSIQRIRERCPEAVNLPVFKDYRDMLREIEMDAVTLRCHREAVASKGAAILRGSDVVLAPQDDAAGLTSTFPALVCWFIRGRSCFENLSCLRLSP